MQLPADAKAFVEQLFSPSSVDRFVRDTWPDRLHHAKGDPSRFAPLGELLAASPRELFRRHNRVLQIHGEDDTGSPFEVALPSGAESAFSDILYRTGQTILLNEAHLSFPVLAGACELLEAAVGGPPGSVDAIVHLSRPGRGLSIHFDDQDVLIVQLRGTKEWLVGTEPAIRYPTKNYRAGDSIIAASTGSYEDHNAAELASYWPKGLLVDHHFVPERAETILVDPGSTLFVPRGFWHRTRAVDESVSISFGFHMGSWASLLSKLVRSRLVRHEAWRQPQFGGWGSATHLTTERAKQAVESLLRGWADDVGDITAADFFPQRPGVEAVMDTLRQRLASMDASDRAAAYQFEFLGDDGHGFAIVFETGQRPRIQEGQHADPDITLRGSMDDFARLLSDPSEAAHLFGTGRITARPMDMGLLGSIANLFFAA